jgi:hypothetical protein
MNRIPGSSEERRQMQSDTEKLLLALAKAERLVRQPSFGAPEAWEALAAVANLTELHFAEEESVGGLEEIATDHPLLSDRLQALFGEHVELRARANELVALAGDGDGTEAWRRKLIGAFEQFQTRFFRHEAARSDLIDEASGEASKASEEISRSHAASKTNHVLS